jgi:hypothetical protein
MSIITERRMCDQCHWRKNAPDEGRWKGYVEGKVAKGILKEHTHVCHKIGTDTWGKITQENVCVGSLNRNCNEKKD